MADTLRGFMPGPGSEKSNSVKESEENQMEEKGSPTQGSGEIEENAQTMDQDESILPHLHVPTFADINLGGTGSAAEAEHEADEVRSPSVSSGIELVRYLPTLPQMFLMICLTQLIMNFFHFVAICSLDSSLLLSSPFLAPTQSWFPVVTWILFLLMNIVCFIYMMLVKSCARSAAASTVFFFLIFVSLFETPLTTCKNDRAFQATFTFFRGIFIVFIAAVYSLAYRQEIVPPRENLPGGVRNWVVKKRLDMP